MCHQTVSLIARHLEASGIATVIMGSAKDIVEHCGVPRFLFSDFPLGNSAGKPNDSESQAATLELALHLLEHAAVPRTMSAEEIARRRAEFDKIKQVGQEVRDATEAARANQT